MQPKSERQQVNLCILPLPSVINWCNMSIPFMQMLKMQLHLYPYILQINAFGRDDLTGAVMGRSFFTVQFRRYLLHLLLQEHCALCYEGSRCNCALKELKQRRSALLCPNLPSSSFCLLDLSRWSYSYITKTPNLGVILYSLFTASIYCISKSYRFYFQNISWICLLVSSCNANPFLIYC